METLTFALIYTESRLFNFEQMAHRRHPVLLCSSRRHQPGFIPEIHLLLTG